MVTGELSVQDGRDQDLKLAVSNGLIEVLQDGAVRFTEGFKQSLVTSILRLDATNTETDLAGLDDISMLAVVSHTGPIEQNKARHLADVVNAVLAAGLKEA